LGFLDALLDCKNANLLVFKDDNKVVTFFKA